MSHGNDLLSVIAKKRNSMRIPISRFAEAGQPVCSFADWLYTSQEFSDTSPKDWPVLLHWVWRAQMSGQKAPDFCPRFFGQFRVNAIENVAARRVFVNLVVELFACSFQRGN